MKNSNVLAIDLAKNTLQLGKFQANGKQIYNRALSRQRLKQQLLKESPSLVAMEACSGAHYWARFARSCGHQVKLMHARSVKAFCTGQKTDQNDAQAIAVAAQQNHLHPVRVLSLDEQSAQALDRAVKLASNQCTALSNQIRGFLGEFGVVIPQGKAALRSKVPQLLDASDERLPESFRQLLQVLWQQLNCLQEQEGYLRKHLEQQVKQIESCQRLLALEGVGPISAFKLWLGLGDGSGYRNGKNAAACFGLTPKQHSSGGKERIGHISRYSADQSLRSTLFQGAMSVIRQLKKRAPNTGKERWLVALMHRRGVKIAAIALCNKTVRTAYALLSNNTIYQPR